MTINQLLEKPWSTLLVEMKEDCLLLTFNRPTKLNALNVEVISELKEFLSVIKIENGALQNGEKIRGLILTGAGEKAFIAGADISEMCDMSPSDAYNFGQLGQQVTELFENLPLPVVACVNGFALGGGLEMAMSADIIYASDNAVFGLPEVKLGLIPGFGGTMRLAKLVGRSLAKEMIFTGRNMLAQEAFQEKLVRKVFPTKEAMIQGALEFFATVKGNSPFAVSIAKKVMNEGVDLTVREGLQLEKRQFSSIFSSEDMREGTKAFVEKRKPQFRGK